MHKSIFCFICKKPVEVNDGRAIAKLCTEHDTPENRETMVNTPTRQLLGIQDEGLQLLVKNTQIETQTDMDDILKADIFFFITTIATIVLSVFLVIVFFYTIRILRDIKHISSVAKEESDTISEELSELRASMHLRQPCRIVLNAEGVETLLEPAHMLLDPEETPPIGRCHLVNAVRQQKSPVVH